MWQTDRPVAPLFRRKRWKEQIAERNVGDSLQRRQRDETVTAAVAVEPEDCVAADDVQTEVAVAERILRFDAEIREQVGEVDPVLAGLEPIDRVPAEVG